MRGATFATDLPPLHKYYFNPHSPCGERRCGGSGFDGSYSISIHTPHAGSDNGCLLLNDVPLLFQSTLPMRGATPVFSLQIRLHNHFNPHSPCGERPPPRYRQRLSCQYFNPHSPCGERRKSRKGKSAERSISIHTPHAGSDVGILHLMHRAFDISIHTPHAGSDLSS